MFVKNKCSLHYTRLEVDLSLLKIPYNRKYHYFCSQFVADILKQSQAVELKKDITLYLPGDFKSITEVQLNFQGNLQSMIKNFGILPCLN